MVRFPAGARVILVSEASIPTLGPTQRPFQQAPGILSPGLKRPGSEVDLINPSSVEFKNKWSYISILPDCFHGVMLNYVLE